MGNLTQGKTIAMGAVEGGMIGSYMTFGLIFYILLVIANWKIFKKAGVSAWKSLIPIYNVYLLYKISGIKKWFWIPIIVAFVFGLISGVAGENKNVTLICSVITGIVNFVVDIMLCNKLAKAFGKGTGFTIGLIFLPNIFTLILGFGNAEYIGAEND